jgi:hypothetical protein
MLTDKKSALIILKGGALSAAFSFIFFLAPAVGIIFHFLALVPLFYVGIRLRLQAFLIASALPILGFSTAAGILGSVTFIITCIVPSALILHWHFHKKGRSFAFSRTDILHNFSKTFLAGILAVCFYAHFTHTNILAMFGVNDDAIKQLLKVSPSLSKMIELLPGISAFMLMLMIWINYQIAYALSIKVQKIRAIDNMIKSLPNFWDIILIGSLWLYLCNKLMVHSESLNIISKTTLCISLFPLMVEGLDILRLMVRAHSVPVFAYFIILTFVFLLVWPMVFVVALGLVEPWYGLKQKYISKLGA